jgi:hypothetical protein
MGTFGAAFSQPEHRSFWRDALTARAGGRPLDEWLLAQANLRGFFGAFGVDDLGPIDAALSVEEIVCGLLQPHGAADGRLFKLVVRILQSGAVDPTELAELARRERADVVLAWLLQQVPEVERNEAIDAVKAALRPPRGQRPPNFRYDPGRLVRRPFRSEEARWTRRHGS